MSTDSHPGGASLSVSVSSRPGAGRAAVRSVLRAAFAEPLPAQQLPRRTGQQLDLDAVPPTLDATYDDESWRRDWGDWLANAMLFVQAPTATPALETSLCVRLRYPPHIDVSCTGKVVMVHAGGFGLGLASDGPALTQADEAPASALPPHAEAFWCELLAELPGGGPIEAMLVAHADFLAPLQGLEPRDRTWLDRLARTPQDDYLEAADELASILEWNDWHWPELAELVEDREDPVGDAAGLIVLAIATRTEAKELTRQAQRMGAKVALRSDAGACPVCEERYGPSVHPLQMVLRGLPPYHLGCQCRVTLTS